MNNVVIDCKKPFGDQMRTFRQQAKLTVRELAIRANRNYANISGIENNKRFPTVDTMLDLFKAMGVKQITFRL